MGRSSSQLEVALGIITILTGLMYSSRIFGPTESEVVTWGIVAAVLGAGIVLLRTNKFKPTQYIKAIFILLIVIIQIPAILLWFTFHGSGIADATSLSIFIAHRIFAIPHMMIVFLGILLILFQYRRKATAAS